MSKINGIQIFTKPMVIIMSNCRPTLLKYAVIKFNADLNLRLNQTGLEISDRNVAVNL